MKTMKRNVVYVQHNGSNVYLDVDRIIAIDPNCMRIYFEDVIWTLSVNDYTEVVNAWLR